MVEFNIDKYLTDQNFSIKNNRTLKLMAKNLLPGMLAILGIGGKLVESKILSVNTTPDGRMYLELLGSGNPGSGIQLTKLTEPIGPNEIVNIKNPYGRDMNNRAAPTYYSEEQVDLFSEIEDTMETCSSKGMTVSESFSEVAKDLLSLGLSEDDTKDILSEYQSYASEIMPRSEAIRLSRRSKNLSKWGVDTDKDVGKFGSGLSLKQRMKAGYGLKHYINGDDWAAIEADKKSQKNTIEMTKTIEEFLGKLASRPTEAQVIMSRLTPEEKKILKELVETKYPHLKEAVYGSN